MGFDYDAPAVPATAVADVVAELRSHGKLRELTDEEKLQRRIENQVYLWECQQRDEERRREHQQQQAEAKAKAEREAAIARAEANRKQHLERQRQITEESRRREIRQLQLAAAKSDWWQKTVENAARQAATLQAQTTLMGELEKMLASPKPEPEPEVIYVGADDLGSPNIADENFNPRYWLHKPILGR